MFAQNMSIQGQQANIHCIRYSNVAWKTYNKSQDSKRPHISWKKELTTVNMEDPNFRNNFVYVTFLSIAESPKTLSPTFNILNRRTMITAQVSQTNHQELKGKNSSYKLWTDGQIAVTSSRHLFSCQLVQVS